MESRKFTYMKALLSLRERGFKNLYELGAVVKELKNSSIVKFLLDLSMNDMVINTSCFESFVNACTNFSA